MELEEISQGDVLILALSGHLDTAAAMPFEERVLRIIDEGARQLLIDCARLDYVNSSGLKVFLLAAKRLDTTGGRVVLCALSSNVRMIFEMIGFDKILTLAPSREEGLQHFQAKASAV